MTKMTKIRDAKGYAMLLANVEQFGNQVVRVYNGSRKVYEGEASVFVAKHSEKFAWTCCSDVREDADGFASIVY